MGLFKTVIADARPAAARVAPPAAGEAGPGRGRPAADQHPGVALAAEFAGAMLSRDISASTARSNGFTGQTAVADEVTAATRPAPVSGRPLRDDSERLRANPSFATRRDLDPAGRPARSSVAARPDANRTVLAAGPQPAAALKADSASPVNDTGPAVANNAFSAGREARISLRHEPPQTAPGDARPDPGEIFTRPPPQPVKPPANRIAAPAESDTLPAPGQYRSPGEVAAFGDTSSPVLPAETGAGHGASAAPRESVAPTSSQIAGTLAFPRKMPAEEGERDGRTTAMSAGAGPQPAQSLRREDRRPPALPVTGDSGHGPRRAASTSAQDQAGAPSRTNAAADIPPPSPTDPAANAGAPQRAQSAADRQRPDVAEAQVAETSAPGAAPLPANLRDEIAARIRDSAHTARNPVAEPLPRLDQQRASMPAIIEVPQSPTVRIGQVDVFVQAPPQRRGATAPARPVPSPASRSYLRRL